MTTVKADGEATPADVAQRHRTQQDALDGVSIDRVSGSPAARRGASPSLTWDDRAARWR
jgi:hypothetical protein